MRSVWALFVYCALSAVCCNGAARDIALFGRLEKMRDEPANTGLTCRVHGVVSHVSAIRPRLIVIAKPDTPYRGGVPVLLPEGIAPPVEGDEVWIDGVTASIVGRIGIDANGFAKISFTPPDFEHRLSRTVDFRRGFMVYRRIGLEGRVESVSFQQGGDGLKDFSVLGVRIGGKTIHTRVPGKIRKADFMGRMVHATGCVLPVVDSAGKVIAYCVEAGSVEDVAPIEEPGGNQLWMAALQIVGGVLAVAFVGALVAWIRSRRARLEMAAVAAERRRMASALHDTIEQHLAGARILLNGALSVKGLPSEATAALTSAIGILANAKLETRDAVMNLRSDEALSRTPEEALRDLAHGIERTGAARVRVRLRGLPKRLPPGVFQDLVAIAREATTNALKHGEAKNIAIVSDPLEGRCGFVLGILNDGKPFDAASALGPEAGHFGLSGMRERSIRSRFGLSFGCEGRWTRARVEVTL